MFADIFIRRYGIINKLLTTHRGKQLSIIENAERNELNTIWIQLTRLIIMKSSV